MSDAITTVCVFGASSPRIERKYLDCAYRLGQLLAGHGMRCVNGGGRDGVMRAVSDGCLDSGGQAVGVIPQFMVDNGWHYPRLTAIEVTPDMHARKSMMARMSQAAVALPGGCGTIEELMEIITWRQLGLYTGAVVILNAYGYYDPLLQMLARCVDHGFMRPSHAGLWRTASTPDEAVGLLLQGAGPAEVEPKY